MNVVFLICFTYFGSIYIALGQTDTANYNLTYKIGKKCYRTIYISHKGYIIKIINFENEGNKCKKELDIIYDDPLAGFLFSTGPYWKIKKYREDEKRLIYSIGLVYYHGPFHDDPVFLFEPANEGVMKDEYTLWGVKVKSLDYTYLNGNPYYKVYHFIGYEENPKRKAFEILFCNKIGVIQYRYYNRHPFKYIFNKERMKGKIRLVKVNQIPIEEYIKTNQSVGPYYDKIAK